MWENRVDCESNCEIYRTLLKDCETLREHNSRLATKIALKNFRWVLNYDIKEFLIRNCSFYSRSPLTKSETRKISVLALRNGFMVEDENDDPNKDSH